ncbi:phospholipase A2 [Hamadaea tsunoensis]|uniref:phospholipase A2 n=1 Tax=Hamadaea tsunoensis TaxID=53368 RepID=UPI0012FCEFCD|nr:phospholipase A2 [Hamadaea tsunoensis]
MARRKVWLAAVLGAVLSTVLIVAPAPAATTVPDVAATDAIRALTASGQAAVPADFAQVMGYTPVTARLDDGELRTVNPDGFCSVPGEGRPFAFDTACKAHDYGYDLLRYAMRRGEPLNTDARTVIDNRLVADLHSQCDRTTSGSEYAACSATVEVFAAGVTFNSWRQMSGPPIDKSGLVRTAGLGLLVCAGLVVAVSATVRRVSARWRRLRPAVAAG